jgi:uncharacterized protein (DUF362 family)
MKNGVPNAQTEPRTMSGRINELYCRWGPSSLLFTLACMAWLVWRVGTNPTRIGYPCQRIALAQIVLYFSSIAIPLVAIAPNALRYVRNNEYLKIAAIVLVVASLIVGLRSYESHRETQLRAMGSGTIALPSAAKSLSAGHPDQVQGLLSSGFPLAPNGLEAVVSVSYDPAIDYGGTAPYDPEVNPAYGFVWDTVERLGLGNSTSPLDELIEPGDKVLIKPNWVDYGPAVYTRPEVVRPLIDMAIAAGANQVYVGDGGVGVPKTNSVMDEAGYSDMLSELDSRHPAIALSTANLNVLSEGWHWVYLGGNSSFAGSGHSHWDLSSDGEVTLFDRTYRRTADPQGVNPNGNTTGWYAVNDAVLDADVIINMPKMKTHQSMISTLAIKNLVGCTLGSTFNEDLEDSGDRIAHCHIDKEENFFNNDIFWRAITDMNKVILYADEEGVLQPTQQRKYLNVIDGIEAMEKSQHHLYGGKGVPYYRHVVLASVDPVAADVVGCRLMGYDFNIIPVASNAASDPVHPIGTNDPQRIAIIGEDLDSRFNHVFQFNPDWEDHAGSLPITDFSPPTIASFDREGGNVTANVSGAVAAYALYQENGTRSLKKMNRDGDTYSVSLPDPASPFRIVAQDEYLNSVNTARPCDANGDGDVNVVDWVRVKRIILGLDSWIHLGADADDDGDVDVSDWVEVKKSILALGT